jgi:hypothetical protein
MRCRRGLGMVVVMSAVASVTACAGRQAGLNTVPGTDHRSDRIGVMEFRAVQGNTAADAVRQLRPEFLLSHGAQTAPTRATVYIDDRFTGDLDVLALVALAEVSEIRYLDMMRAKNLFGSYCRCDGGVILVRTLR